MISLETEKSMIAREIVKVVRRLELLKTRDELGKASVLLQDLTERHKEIEKLLDIEKKKNTDSSD